MVEIVCMHSALKLLVLAGLVMWGFILMEQHFPDYAPNIQLADPSSERCQKFGREEYGVRTLQYGDRIRQIFAGCW